MPVSRSSSEDEEDNGGADKKYGDLTPSKRAPRQRRERHGSVHLALARGEKDLAPQERASLLQTAVAQAFISSQAPIAEEPDPDSNESNSDSAGGSEEGSGGEDGETRPNLTFAVEVSGSIDDLVVSQKKEKKQKSRQLALDLTASAAVETEEEIRQDYTWDEYEDVIGEGATARVFRARRRVAQGGEDEVALKIVDASLLERNSGLLREIRILRSLDHPGIVHLEDFRRTATHLYIVQELARGPELFEALIDRRSFSERDAANLTGDVLEALEYMHARGIAQYVVAPFPLTISAAGRFFDPFFLLPPPFSFLLFYSQPRLEAREPPVLRGAPGGRQRPAVDARPDQDHRLRLRGDRGREGRQRGS
jgi:Protein kinase domain